MTQTQYPVVLEVKAADKGIQVQATTSIDRALRDAKSLQAQLRCIEVDYRTTLAAVREALGSTGKGCFRDPRAFWFAGKYLTEFIARLESHAFYLVEKNITPAKHLGISRASVEKMMAFYGRYPDPFRIDTSVPWALYRDNKEPRGPQVPPSPSPR
jgi:hypothetical protein